MLEDLASAAGRVGLEMHSGKTKILANACGGRKGRPKAADLAFGKVDILPLMESTLYLGCKFAFGNSEDTEIEYRIARGWAKFMESREQLCSTNCALHHRMRLWDAIVTPTVLYGCSSWTMTAERERKLKVAQRQMIRNMVGIPLEAAE